MNAIGIVSCLGFVGILLGWGLLARRYDGQRSGWVRLGQRYPAGRRPVGAGLGRASVGLNGCRYRDLADVRIGGGGVYLGLPAVFRPYHPPLLFPWDDVTAADVTVAGELPLTVGDGATITLTGRAAELTARVLARRAAPRRLRHGRR